MGSLFKDVNNENIDEYCHSVDKCSLSLSSIFYILDSYKIIRKNPEEGITLLNAQLEGISKTIESEKSYQLFCELIGGEFFIGEEPEETIPLFQLIKGITETSIPYYPWQSNETNSLIYEDKFEEAFINDLEKTKDKKVEVENFLMNFEFDKTFLSIINEMKRFPRSREILNLYQTILLIKDFVIKEEFINQFEDSFGEKDKLNDFYIVLTEKIKEAKKKNITLFENFMIESFAKPNKDSSKEDKGKSLSWLMDTPRALFIAHFYAAGLNISEKVNLKFLSEINDSKFKDLQKRLINFASLLLKIKNQFGSTLDEINNYYQYKNDKDKEINELVKDVLTFFQNRDVDWEKKFPTSRELSSMRPGGAGILKRINKLEGLNSFKLCFFEYIKSNKEKKYIESYVNPMPTAPYTWEKVKKKSPKN